MPRTRSFDPDVVIDAAVEQFWTASYGTTSTEDLCETSQLSRSSLYNTFGSKRELYLRSLRRYVQRKQGQRADLMEQDLTGRQLVEAIGHTLVTEQWDDASRRACLGINACIEIGPSDPAVAELLEANASDFDAVLEIAIRRGQTDGSVRDDLDASALARAVHAAFDGLQVRARVAPSAEVVHADVRTVLALL